MDKSRARYEQGLAAYQSGQSVMHLMDVGKEIRREHDAIPSRARDPNVDPDETNKLHEEIARSEHALIAGFADGLIKDIRDLTLSPSFTRRGQTA